MEWVYLFFGIALLVSSIVAFVLVLFKYYEKRRKIENSNSKDR